MFFIFRDLPEEVKQEKETEQDDNAGEERLHSCGYNGERASEREFYKKKDVGVEFDFMHVELPFLWFQ